MNLDWIEENTVLLVRTGSHGYGTNIETSDEDFKAVVVPPLSYYLGLDSFNEQQKTNSKDFKLRMNEEVDISAIHLSKFIKDAMSGVPNNLEILFADKSNVIQQNVVGAELCSNKELFLSKRVYNRMRGYAKSQIMKLVTKQQNRTGRQGLVNEYGYDTKFGMHGIRLLYSAIEILETGNLTVMHPQRELLLDIRKGKYSLKELEDMFIELDSRLTTVYESSSLRNSPDYNKINELLIHLNKKALNLKEFL